MGYLKICESMRKALNILVYKKDRAREWDKEREIKRERDRERKIYKERERWRVREIERDIYKEREK